MSVFFWVKHSSYLPRHEERRGQFFRVGDAERARILTTRVTDALAIGANLAIRACHGGKRALTRRHDARANFAKVGRGAVAVGRATARQ